MAASYIGFSARQKWWVAGSAIAIICVSLAFAAWIMGDALRNVPFGPQDQEAVNRLLGDTTDPLHKSMLRAQAIDAIANLKQLANRQSIIAAAFAGVLALCALGFALFLLGADRAFQLQTQPGQSGPKLWLMATAPGMACFVFALILMGMALVHRPGSNPAPNLYSKQIMAASGHAALPAAPAAAPSGIVAGKGEEQKAREAAAQRSVEQAAQALAAEKAAAEKAAAEKAAAEKAAAEKSAADKMRADEQAAEKAASEKAAAEKA